MPDRTSAPGALQARGKTGNATRPEPISPALLLVYVMWVLMLFEPEWWLASFGAAPLKYLPTVLLPVVIVVALVHADRRAICWPMALFLVAHIVPLPFVTNRGYAMPLFKTVLLYYVVLVLSAATIDRVRKVLPIVSMYLLQFLWWGIHGVPHGRVGWHSLLSNEDAFGPMMVIGVGYASFIALGARSVPRRLLAIFTAGLSGVGIVSSVARGAAMAAAVVVVAVWLRAPRKIAMFFGVVLVVGTMVVSSYVFFPDGEFWTEMASIVTDIKGLGGGEVTEEECTRAASNRKCGSATDRWDLWTAGWRVFLRSPVYGVGPGNFGAWASENFQWGDAEGQYEDPAHLYGRVLHNVYVQILAEQGVIGAAIFLSILIDFVRRNRGLRKKIAIERWDAAADGRTDLRSLSLGLEGAMLGFLVSGVFYDQLYMSAFYTIVSMNFLLSCVIARQASADDSKASAENGVQRPSNARGTGA